MHNYIVEKIKVGEKMNFGEWPPSKYKNIL